MLDWDDDLLSDEQRRRKYKACKAGLAGFVPSFGHPRLLTKGGLPFGNPA